MMNIMKALRIGLLATFFGMVGCEGGGGVGVCQSSLVAYYGFSASYCYSNFTAAECSDYDAQDVNGGSPWYYYGGQTCADRGLNEGSNYY